MNKKFTRRSFVTTTLTGLGGVALGSSPGLLKEPEKTRGKVRASKAKSLFATTDFSDNILINHQGTRYGSPVNRSEDYYSNNRCFMNRKQLDELHKFLVSIGVTRHQWIVDTMWQLYDDYPHGFDLLAEAAKSAKKVGIEFYAVIKPFEGGCFGTILPSTMPCPEGAGAIKDLRGIFPTIRPFVAANPSLSLKRKPESFECIHPVSTIRLVKGDDRPSRIKAEHLSIWSSKTNNQFILYDGPVSFRETIEKRYRFPYWRECRVLHLEGLQIPLDHKYVLVKCALADEKGNFTNEKGNILELVGGDGKILPHTLSTGPVKMEEHEGFYQSKLLKKVVRYLQMAEVQSEISDPERLKEHYRDFYSFGEYNVGDMTTLDKEGYVAAACGKPEYIPGHLNPVYPEVREHWLDFIRFCLDRGVDGINIRISNHTLSTEPWEYGFNEPVLLASNGKTDFAAISRINGDGYTLFLREARKLIKSRGKSLAVHLETNLLMPDERPGKISSYPYNFEWQWETWVNEIADEFEIRGVYELRPWNLAKAIAIFSQATIAVRKPLYLEGDFHGMSFDGPFASTEAEIEMVKNHPGLDGYVFYETANITRLNENGQLEGSPGIENVLNKSTFGKRNKV